MFGIVYTFDKATTSSLVTAAQAALTRSGGDSLMRINEHEFPPHISLGHFFAEYLKGPKTLELLAPLLPRTLTFHPETIRVGTHGRSYYTPDGADVGSLHVSATDEMTAARATFINEAIRREVEPMGSRDATEFHPHITLFVCNQESCVTDASFANLWPKSTTLNGQLRIGGIRVHGTFDEMPINHSFER